MTKSQKKLREKMIQEIKTLVENWNCEHFKAFAVINGEENVYRNRFARLVRKGWALTKSETERLDKGEIILRYTISVFTRAI